MKKIIFFCAPWCAACKALRPAVEMMPDAEVVDVSENPEIAEKYGVASLPTFVFVRGVEWLKIAGAMSEQEIRKTFDSL